MTIYSVPIGQSIFAACKKLQPGTGDIIEIEGPREVVDLIGIPKGCDGVTVRAVGGPVVLLPGLEFPYYLSDGNPGGPGRFSAAVGKGLIHQSGNAATFIGLIGKFKKNSSSNGSAYRIEGNDALIRDGGAIGCQIGVLAGNGLIPTDSEIIFEGGEYAYSKGGLSIDQGHNFYIGKVRRVVTLNVLSHHCFVGHQFKSLAREHDIHGRFYDGLDGTSSYALDIAGGILTLRPGSYFQKGALSSNQGALVFYYTGRSQGGPHEIHIDGGVTFECLRTDRRGSFVRVMNDAAGAPPITGSITGNALYVAANGWDGAPFMVPAGVVVGGNTITIGAAPPLGAPPPIIVLPPVVVPPPPPPVDPLAIAIAARDAALAKLAATETELAVTKQALADDETLIGTLYVKIRALEADKVVLADALASAEALAAFRRAHMDAAIRELA